MIGKDTENLQKNEILIILELLLKCNLHNFSHQQSFFKLFLFSKLLTLLSSFFINYLMISQALLR